MVPHEIIHLLVSLQHCRDGRWDLTSKVRECRIPLEPALQLLGQIRLVQQQAAQNAVGRQRIGKGTHPILADVVAFKLV